MNQISILCKGPEAPQIKTESESSLDALQTIISCSQHQKRIIDDILTLSKLNSDLILITPVRVQPSKVAHDAVKIFLLECAKDEIGLHFREDPSLAETGAKWAMLDSSRLLQALMNLLTNAIKFTRTQLRKDITVTIGATHERPVDNWNAIKFAPPRSQVNNLLDELDWGEGQKVFLWITVQDSGCGLTPEEQSHLFTRFSQATPRTHVAYGGSGLGLFISKSLTEMHGAGGIGVRSESGIGSTFAFFIGVRLAASPTQEEPSLGIVRGDMRRLSIEERIKKCKYSVLLVEDNLINVSCFWKPQDITHAKNSYSKKF